MKSQARTAGMLALISPGIVNPPKIVSATETSEQMKMITPKTRHFSFLMPKMQKNPARSIRIPTAADASAGTLSAMIASRAEIGERIPQIM